MPAVRSGRAGETRNFGALISGFTAALAAVNAAMAATARVTFLLADDPHDIESDTPPRDFARLNRVRAFFPGWESYSSAARAPWPHRPAAAAQGVNPHVPLL